MSAAVKFDPVKEETKLRPCIDLSKHVNKFTRVSHAKLDDLSVTGDDPCLDMKWCTLNIKNLMSRAL
jgi:hypothetical protein